MSTVSDDISHENDIIKNLMSTHNTDYFQQTKGKLMADKNKVNQVTNYYQNKMLMNKKVYFEG